MGVEPFLISSTLEAVLGQRLLRSICPQCRTTYQPSEALLDQLGLSRSDIGAEEFFLRQGLRRLQPDWLQRPQGDLRVDEDYRSAAGVDQRASAHGDVEGKAVELEW